MAQFSVDPSNNSISLIYKICPTLQIKTQIRKGSESPQATANKWQSWDLNYSAV